ncbi:hypothetical protein [Rhizobium leguminosarum]|uniref:hypothetical protein n=1 Tax=Rhizobium leguminosarum TaxID=384 RepID=UPI0010370D80|nr:hypothetical protein [Rhizobium leguminosarum]TBF85827.1 hypothetical protein ELG85_37025 [Rhizobium leguminosarum]
MFKEHPTFIAPPDENAKIWRYMDLAKFISLLQKKSLYFTRADKFEDQFEGSWPVPNVIARNLILPPGLPTESIPGWNELNLHRADFNRQFRTWCAVNCWHMNEYESAAMWKLYVQAGDGIAIQSTYARLRDSISSEEEVFIGAVNYIDYEKHAIDAGNVLSSIVHKRTSFSHESELRAVVVHWPSRQHSSIEHGVAVPIDLKRLVQKVYVSPSASNWFADLLQPLIVQYGFDFAVNHSSMNSQVVF